MNIPVKIGEHCWNDISDQNGNECKVLITKTDISSFILQCDAQDIDERFKSLKELQLYCDEKFGCSVGSYCCN